MNGGHAAASQLTNHAPPVQLDSGTELIGLDGIVRYLCAPSDLLHERPRFGRRLRIELFGETLGELVVRGHRAGAVTESVEQRQQVAHARSSSPDRSTARRALVTAVV